MNLFIGRLALEPALVLIVISVTQGSEVVFELLRDDLFVLGIAVANSLIECFDNIRAVNLFS